MKKILNYILIAITIFVILMFLLTNFNKFQFFQDNILFLTIRSNLKQSNNAQKLMIYTYNYDLKEQKSHTLDELIQILNYDKAEIQNLINTEIKSQEENANSLKELGYSIYLRDSSSDIYKVENSDYFFIKDGRLYIIYPYGNEAVTSEMDLVII